MNEAVLFRLLPVQSGTEHMKGREAQIAQQGETH